MFPQPTVLVIPCYNEQERLDLASIKTALCQDEGLCLCFVDDGSTDDTYSVLQAFREGFPARVTVLQHKTNRGKGEAVRFGVLHAIDSMEPGSIGYWDADLATPLDQLKEFSLEANRYSDWLALLGCRHQRLGTDIRRSILRHYIGRIFASIVSPLLNLPIYDTQCGAKIFRPKLAQQIFMKPFYTRWCFDVEVLARILSIYGVDETSRRVVEIPLRKWRDIPHSKIGPGDVIAVLREILTIKIKYSLPFTSKE